MEDTVERIVAYFRHAAQGLEERKQILYLLGPVGGGKSSLAERLKADGAIPHLRRCVTATR
jgi:serine protein kinase